MIHFLKRDVKKLEMQSMKKTFFLMFTKFSFKIGFSLEHIYFNFLCMNW